MKDFFGPAGWGRLIASCLLVGIGGFLASILVVRSLDHGPERHAVRYEVTSEGETIQTVTYLTAEGWKVDHGVKTKFEFGGSVKAHRDEITLVAQSGVQATVIMCHLWIDGKLVDYEANMGTGVIVSCHA